MLKDLDIRVSKKSQSFSANV